MPVIRSMLIATLALAPAAAFAQTVIVEPPMMPDEVMILPGEPMPEAPMMMGPLVEEDAVEVAMMNGIVEVEDVHRTFGGDFEVEGADATGDDLEIVVDAETGEVLDIDD